MDDLIKLCENWMGNGIIIRKQIKIENSDYTLFLDTKLGMRIEFSLNISRFNHEKKKRFLTLIDELIKYDIERNIPF
jgi:hypothetical protein